MRGDFAGKFHLMRDQNHGAAFGSQIADHVQHLTHEFRVERGGGFIKQHGAGFDAKRAGDGGALLLAP